LSSLLALAFFFSSLTRSLNKVINAIRGFSIVIAPFIHFWAYKLVFAPERG